MPEGFPPRRPSLAILSAAAPRPEIPAVEEPGVLAWRDADGVVRALGAVVAGHAWLHVLGLASFCLTAPRDRVTAVPHGAADRATAAEIRDRFERTALPLALHARGWVVLHGSAVAGPGGVLGFLGASTSGKSTLAHALCRRGYAPWADDALALAPIGREAPVVAVPLPSRPRLRTVSARHFGAPERGSREAGATGVVAAGGPRRLAGLCLLGPRGAGAPRLERVAPADALPELLGRAHIFALDDDVRRGYFEQLLRLAAAVPTTRLHLPDDLAALPAVATLLEERFFPSAA